MAVTTPSCLRLSPDLEAGAHARKALEARLRDDLPYAVLRVVLLVVTELVNNAVTHGAGAIELNLTLAEGQILGEVADEGSGFTYVHPEPDAEAVGGLGLLTVSRLSRSWGIREGNGGVWFAIDQ